MTTIVRHRRLARTQGMNMIRVLGWAVVAGMVAAIAYGFAAGNFSDEASSIWSLPWGKVTLIDLYAGLAIFGGWIAFRERKPGRVALWWVALATLGNLAAGAYLLVALHGSKNSAELLLGRSS
jgi:hypothetical protein